MTPEIKEAFLKISQMIYMLAKHVENGSVAIPEIRSESADFDNWINNL